MTLNLKLVRHQDGKWTALTPESDDLAPVPVTEKKSAPIDPAQLLKALDSLLSPDGGIRSIEDVPRLASLMKKFSKKLVSRCVYCNVLQATKSEILSEFLDKGGWETINTWLQYAKTSSADSFLLEMLKLCKQLPMTLNRLKENNTAKLIKSLTKHENNDVKELSNVLVTQWMTIIKDKKTTAESIGEKKKKKEKPVKIEKVEETKVESKSPKHVVESPKGPGKLKGVKRPSSEKETKPPEIYEDVKIDPTPLIPISKKPRTDRPKTAKIYQKKFRATGLEEATPLPKNISKKTSTVDKSAAVAAAKSTLKLNTSPLDRIIEKKIKPENLLAINENANSKGIKLIPAKPRPTYTLQESASFIDALVSQPVVAPIKRKKKVSPKTPSPQQTSPTISPPKFQFYKDTLEEKMSEENKNQEPEKSETPENEAENKSDNPTNNAEENTPMEVTEEVAHTPPNPVTNETGDADDFSNQNDESHKRLPFDPNHLRSILSHGRRKGRKKSVRWVEDSEIKEVFYFDMDDTERVNVSRNSNFYDLKSIEMKRERETMELAKRQANDQVEEFRKWWTVPIKIDAPPPLVEPGSQSQEKQVELLRQQSTLQEIYFTREMIPDSPHEPDLEIVAPQEPKVIPLDEENLICPLNDFSNFKPVQPSLPEILSSLMKINASQALSQITQNVESLQVPMETEPVQQQTLNIDAANQPIIPMPLIQQVPEPQHMNINGMLGPGMPPFQSPPHGHNHGPVPGLMPPHGPLPAPEFQGEWQGPPPDMSPPNEFYQGFPMNPNMPPHNQPHPGMNMRGGGGGGGGNNNFRPNFRGGPRGSRPRNRVICRHFANGHCRFGMNCTFLHPGVNGPPL